MVKVTHGRAAPSLGSMSWHAQPQVEVGGISVTLPSPLLVPTPTPTLTLVTNPDYHKLVTLHSSGIGSHQRSVLCVGR